VVLAANLTALGAIASAPSSASPADNKTAPVSFSSAGPLRFAQISEVHLFDAGYKCSGLYVQPEYEENLEALQWAIDEINRRWKSGDKVDFLIFTGDLGIVNLTGTPVTHTPPDANSKCSDARTAWMANGLDNPKVVGIFAGHFHDDNPAHYGGPLINPAVEFIYTAGAGPRAG
jgi:hypothetical protein